MDDATASPFVLTEPSDDERFQIFLNHLALGQLDTAIAIAPSDKPGTLAARYREVLSKIAQEIQSEATDSQVASALSDGSYLDPHLELHSSSNYPTVATLRRAVAAKLPVEDESIVQTIPLGEKVDTCIRQLATAVASLLCASGSTLATISRQTTENSPLNDSAATWSQARQASTSLGNTPADSFASIYGTIVSKAAFIHRSLDNIHLDETDDDESTKGLHSLPFSRVFSFFEWIVTAVVDSTRTTADAEGENAPMKWTQRTLVSTLVEAERWVTPFHALWTHVHSFISFDDKSANSPLTIARGVFDKTHKFSQGPSRGTKDLFALHATFFAVIFLTEDAGECTEQLAQWKAATAHSCGYAIASNSINSVIEDQFAASDITIVASYLAQHACWTALSDVIHHANIATSSSQLFQMSLDDDEQGIGSLPSKFLSEDAQVAQQAWRQAVALSTSVASTATSVTGTLKSTHTGWPVDTILANVLALSVVRHLAGGARKHASLRRRRIPTEEVDESGLDAGTSSPVQTLVAVAREFLSLPAFGRLKPLVAAHCYLSGPAGVSHLFLREAADTWSVEDHCEWIHFLVGGSTSIPSAALTVRQWLLACVDMFFALVPGQKRVTPLSRSPLVRTSQLFPGVETSSYTTEHAQKLVHIIISGGNLISLNDFSATTLDRTVSALRDAVGSAVLGHGTASFATECLRPQIALLDLALCIRSLIRSTVPQSVTESVATLLDGVVRLTSSISELKVGKAESADAAIRLLTEYAVRCSLMTTDVSKTYDFVEAHNAETLRCAGRILSDLQCIQAHLGPLASPECSASRLLDAVVRRVSWVQEFNNALPFVSIAAMFAGYESMDSMDEHHKWLVVSQRVGNADEARVPLPKVSPPEVIARVLSSPSLWLLERAAALQREALVTRLLQAEFTLLDEPAPMGRWHQQFLELVAGERLFRGVCEDSVACQHFFDDDLCLQLDADVPISIEVEDRLLTASFGSVPQGGIIEVALAQWDDVVVKTRIAMKNPVDAGRFEVLEKEVAGAWSALEAAVASLAKPLPSRSLADDLAQFLAQHGRAPPMLQVLRDVRKLAVTHAPFAQDDSVTPTPQALLEDGWNEIARHVSTVPLTEAITSQLMSSRISGGHSTVDVFAQVLKSWKDCLRYAEEQSTRQILFQNIHQLGTLASNEFSVQYHGTDSSWNRSEATAVCSLYVLASNPTTRDRELIFTWVAQLPEEVRSSVDRKVHEWIAMADHLAVLKAVFVKLHDVAPGFAAGLFKRLKSMHGVDLIANARFTAMQVASELVDLLSSKLCTASGDDVTNDRAIYPILVQLVQHWGRFLAEVTDQRLVALAGALLCAAASDSAHVDAVRLAVEMLRRVRDPRTLLDLLFDPHSGADGEAPHSRSPTAAVGASVESGSQRIRRAFVALVPYADQQVMLCLLRNTASLDDAREQLIELELRRIRDAEHLRKEANEAGWNLVSPVPFITWNTDVVSKLHEALVKNRQYDAAFLLVTLARTHCTPEVVHALAASDLTVSTHVAMATSSYVKALKDGQSQQRALLAFLKCVVAVAEEELGSLQGQLTLEACKKLVTWRLVTTIVQNRGDVVPVDIAALVAHRVVRLALESRALKPIFSRDKTWLRTLLGTAVLAALQCNNVATLPRTVQNEVRESLPLREYHSSPSVVVESLLRCGRLDLVALIIDQVPQIQCDDVLCTYAAKAISIDVMVAKIQATSKHAMSAIPEPNEELSRWSRNPAHFVLSIVKDSGLLPASTTATQLLSARDTFTYAGAPSATFAVQCYQMCRDKQYAATEILNFCSLLFNRLITIQSERVAVPIVSSIGITLMQTAATLASQQEDVDTVATAAVPPPVEVKKRGISFAPELGNPSAVLDAMPLTERCLRVERLFSVASKLSMCGEGLMMPLENFAEPKNVRELLQELRKRSASGEVAVARAVAVDLAAATSMAGGAEAHEIQEENITTLIDLGYTDLAVQAISDLPPAVRELLLPRCISQLEYTPIPQTFAVVFAQGNTSSAAGTASATDGQLRQIGAAEVNQLIDRRRKAIMKLLEKYGDVRDLCAFALRSGNIAAAARFGVVRDMPTDMYYHLIVHPIVVSSQRSKIAQLQEAIRNVDPTFTKTAKYVDLILEEFGLSHNFEELYHWSCWKQDWLGAAKAALTLAVSPPFHLVSGDPASSQGSFRKASSLSGASTNDTGAATVGRGAAAPSTTLNNRKVRSMIAPTQRLAWLQQAEESFKQVPADHADDDLRDAIRVCTAEQQLLKHCRQAHMPDEQLNLFTLYEPPPSHPIPLSYFAAAAQTRSRRDGGEATVSRGTLELLFRLGTADSANLAVSLATNLDLALAEACLAAIRWASTADRFVVMQTTANSLLVALVAREDRNQVYEEIVKLYVMKHHRIREAEALLQRFGDEPCSHKRMALMLLGNLHEAYMDAIRDPQRGEAVAEVRSMCKKICQGFLKLERVTVADATRVEELATRSLRDFAPHLL